jgi:site-specific recombinase XerC
VSRLPIRAAAEVATLPQRDASGGTELGPAGVDPDRAVPAPLPCPDPGHSIDWADASALLPGAIPARPGDPAPLGSAPARVRAWFDVTAAAEIPDYDGTLETARAAGTAYARRAKAENTRRAYRAGVRAWCAWCDRHALSCLPADAADIVAFLAAERRSGRKANTIDLRRAAIRYLHFIAGCPVPTAEASVAETVAGIHRDAASSGELPAKKLAATVEILREILAPIGDDLVGLRDRALLLLGFAGALRRSELAAIRVDHLELRERGLRLILPVSKGDRDGKGVNVAIPYGSTALCPVRALKRWQQAAAIADGPLFRRIWAPPPRGGVPRPLTVGHDPIDPRTVARIVQARAAAAGYDATALGGHSLKRGAMTTGMDRGVHPTRLKRLGRHKSYAVMDEYLELGDPFDGHPLNGLL